MNFLISNKFRTAVIALVIANIIWGAAPPVFKWAMQDIPPFTLAFLRFALSAIIILPFAYKYLRVAKHEIAEVFLMGFIGVTVSIAFFFLGLKLAPSINASIIGSAGPIFLILASFFILHEKPKNKLIVGALIGLVGVIIIMFEPLFSSEPNFDIFGNLFFFLAMLGGLGHTILGRELVKKYNPFGLTFWSFLIGTACFFPLMIQENLHQSILSMLTFQSVTGILYGAIFCSAIGYFLFFWALKYMQAAETGVFVYIDPIITVLVALPLLGEKPDLYYFIGAILVFFGIYVAEGRIHYHPFHLLKHKG